MLSGFMEGNKKMGVDCVSSRNRRSQKGSFSITVAFLYRLRKPKRNFGKTGKARGKDLVVLKTIPKEEEKQEGTDKQQMFRFYAQTRKV